MICDPECEEPCIVLRVEEVDSLVFSHPPMWVSSCLLGSWIILTIDPIQNSYYVLSTLLGVLFSIVDQLHVHTLPLFSGFPPRAGDPEHRAEAPCYPVGPHLLLTVSTASALHACQSSLPGHPALLTPLGPTFVLHAYISVSALHIRSSAPFF